MTLTGTRAPLVVLLDRGARSLLSSAMLLIAFGWAFPGSLPAINRHRMSTISQGSPHLFRRPHSKQIEPGSKHRDYALY